MTQFLSTYCRFTAVRKIHKSAVYLLPRGAEKPQIKETPPDSEEKSDIYKKYAPFLAPRIDSPENEKVMITDYGIVRLDSHNIPRVNPKFKKESRNFAHPVAENYTENYIEQQFFPSTNSTMDEKYVEGKFSDNSKTDDCKNFENDINLVSKPATNVREDNYFDEVYFANQRHQFSSSELPNIKSDVKGQISTNPYLYDESNTQSLRFQKNLSFDHQNNFSQENVSSANQKSVNDQQLEDNYFDELLIKNSFHPLTGNSSIEEPGNHGINFNENFTSEVPSSKNTSLEKSKILKFDNSAPETNDVRKYKNKEKQMKNDKQVNESKSAYDYVKHLRWERKKEEMKDHPNATFPYLMQIKKHNDYLKSFTQRQMFNLIKNNIIYNQSEYK